ncbi:28S ribosomal protein S21, mitochondrial [Orussus abietinus]|uniref:28S ribosomal protein S21, mitochondrial n=1 Tax=Orussus abietinus TaxID=222816 RepID=UPI000626D34F|nr:28S ribosomal protein S21, mitochondrial [Orussus abietinus]XP_012285704.1 28S ribosomal protein S21, mitochondrial [Orussus abietinus]
MRGIKHTPFIARTVFVQNGDVDGACRVLNRLMGREGIFERWRQMMFYEKPTRCRRRVNYERCKAIYDEDMNRKIQFVLRKNRVDPYPGCL